MPLLSRKVDYALLILSYLHHRPEGGSAREVAERLALSRPFTANILKLLCQKGFVCSERGVRGGYLLRRPAGQICLCDLVDALDGPIHLAECNQSAGEGRCSFTEVCPVRSALSEVDRRLREVLSTVTLADLFRASDPRGCEGPGCTQFGLEVGVLEG